MAVGKYVVLTCEKYKEFIPQIAKLKTINKSCGTVKVEWLHGSYHSTWIEWKYRGKVIIETVPQRSVLHAPLTFTPAMRLKSADIVTLKINIKLLNLYRYV